MLMPLSSSRPSVDLLTDDGADEGQYAVGEDRNYLPQGFRYVHPACTKVCLLHVRIIPVLNSYLSSTGALAG